MADRLTTEQRRLNMSRVRAKDTAPEMKVRQLLHKMGFRFRLHRRDLPGKPDVVLPRYRAVIFVNGCFWHGHDCHLFRMPATRPEFWAGKIEANRTRDRAARTKLAGLGWRSLSVWECALKGTARLEIGGIERRLAGFVIGDAREEDIRGG